MRALTALCALPRGRDRLPGGAVVEKTRRGLYLTAAGSPPLSPLSLDLRGQTLVPGLVRIDAAPCADGPVYDNPFVQALSRAALEGAVVRFRRAGDFIRPLGMSGRKLLSDYLTDRGVDRPLRDYVPLVAREGEVLWAVRACPGRVGRKAYLYAAAGVLQILFWRYQGMKNDLAKVLITQEEIQKRVAELGAEIARDYVEKEPILV